jgi:hypothetical protein
LHTAPEAPSKRAPVPADLERVILACLAKDPAARPQSAQALAEALSRCSDARSWSEADAEVFWSGAPEAAPRLSPAGSGEQARRTAFRVDLEARFGRLEGVLRDLAANDPS